MNQIRFGKIVCALAFLFLSGRSYSQSVDSTSSQKVKTSPDSMIVTPSGYIDVSAPHNDLTPKRDSTKATPSLGLTARADSSKSQSLNLPKGALDTTNLSFKDTDLRDIFRALSIQHGLNVFLDNSINKHVSISLAKVQVYDAIKFLADQNGLSMQIEGGIFKITPPPPVIIPPVAPRIPIVAFNHQALAVELKNDDIEKVVDEIHKKTGFNILLINGTTGTITGTLSNVEFELGFTQLMNNNGFAVQMKNGIFIVSRQDYFTGAQPGNQPGTQQKSGPYWVSVKDSLVTIDVTNAPIERVLPDMIRQLNTDVVFYNTLSGTTTIRATNITLSRALDMILRNTNFTYRVSDGLYFVGEKTNKALSVTKLIRLKHLRSDKILDMLPQSITTLAVVKPVKDLNGVVIIGSTDVIAQLEEFLDQVDKPVAQVMIEALVVDYDLSNGSEFGIQAGIFGSPDTSGILRSGSYVPGIDVEAKGPWINQQLEKAGTVSIFGHDLNIASLGPLPADFYFKLKAMEQKGLANIKSRPLISTLNGQPASLSIGQTQYFLLKTTTPYRDQNQVVFQESQSFQTIEADVKLDITPYVSAESLITVEIKPDFRTPVGTLNPIVPPTINRRALSSTVVIRAGETIVLGGLISEYESETRSQVPILGSIPILGNLFASTSKLNKKSELLIYVTPHISYGEAFQNVSIPKAEEYRDH